MNSMKRQKVMTLKDELCRSVGVQYAMENSGEIPSERMKRLRQSEKERLQQTMQKYKGL